MKIRGEYFLISLLFLSAIGCLSQGVEDSESSVSSGESSNPILEGSFDSTNTSPTPSPSAAQSPSPSASSGPTLTGSAALDEEEKKFVSLINGYRVQYGLTELEVSFTLTQASDWLSTDMATRNYFDHTDSGGRDPFSRMEDFGYTHSTSSAENIAAGNSDAEATFAQWKNSPGHNANMLGRNYRAIGVGRAFYSKSSYDWYWTTNFGSKIDLKVQW